ncbi:hypothetical protein QAD02_020808 [Eretmocerus hayati]|uniref:Uncharacterized protein n=1 Tax=Eretmocerus hayati TaxID=131215 RepID=A0ACC2PN30_9HYME|nr:hypothetical protein QAD02_020808 [Eretmocerus hayati]
MIAVTEVFPDADINGCQFHYKSATLKKWVKLGLPLDRHTETLEAAWALSLLSENLWDDGTQHCGLAVLRRCATEIRGEFPHVTFFVNYIVIQWVPLRAIVSVYGNFMKTTNICKTWHKIANGEFGRHSPFFTFAVRQFALLLEEGYMHCIFRKEAMLFEQEGYAFRVRCERCFQSKATLPEWQSRRGTEVQFHTHRLLN